jgi:tetratricopeptide (TPR) repeat protein
MRTLPLLAACGAVSAVVAAAVALLGPAGAPESADVGAAADDAELRVALEELRAQDQAMRAEIAALRLAGGAPPVSREPAFDEMIERAVARWMQQNGGIAAGEGAGADAPETVVAAEFDAEASLAALRHPLLEAHDRDRIWQAAHEAGRTQELILALEQAARLDPKNVALQYELGYGYLMPITLGEVSGMEAGTWSVKADKAFDAVLALDENHWDARFSKAVSYSFWPPLFGKQQAAIDHFEILVAKQSAMPQRPEFAETYLFLGNMYQQTGNGEKAKEAWNQGLAAFPNHAELRQRLGL